MSLQNMLSQFTSNTTPGAAGEQGGSSPFSAITSALPGSLAGGAAARGVTALLMGSKSARDVEIAQAAIPVPAKNASPLHLTMVKAMISADKADDNPGPTEP